MERSIRSRSPCQHSSAIATPTCWPPKISTSGLDIASAPSTPASRPACATWTPPSYTSSADYGFSTRFSYLRPPWTSLIQSSIIQKVNDLSSMINYTRSGCAACSCVSAKLCARGKWNFTACCPRCAPTLRTTWREQKSVKSCWRALGRPMPGWRVSFTRNWTVEAWRLSSPSNLAKIWSVA